MRPKKRPGSDQIDPERLARDLQSPDEAVRAKAVGSLCPCRIGIGEFQRHLDALARYRKDPSPAVRAAALHVFEDAGEMENEGCPTSPRENTNEMMRRRRAARFLPDDIDDMKDRHTRTAKIARESRTRTRDGL